MALGSACRQIFNRPCDQNRTLSHLMSSTYTRAHCKWVSFLLFSEFSIRLVLSPQLAVYPHDQTNVRAVVIERNVNYPPQNITAISLGHRNVLQRGLTMPLNFADVYCVTNFLLTAHESKEPFRLVKRKIRMDGFNPLITNPYTITVSQVI